MEKNEYEFEFGPVIMVDSMEKAEEISEKMLASPEGTVLGIDIEAAIEMTRFGKLCLIQVFR